MGSCWCSLKFHQILLMKYCWWERRKGDNRKGRQIVLEKGRLTILTPPCWSWTSPYPWDCQLKNSDPCLCVSHPSRSQNTEWHCLMVDQALWKALFHSWEKTVWAGEPPLVLPLLSVIWAVSEGHAVFCEGISFCFLWVMIEGRKETEARVETWSWTLFKTKFVFSSKSLVPLYNP